MFALGRFTCNASYVRVLKTQVSQDLSRVSTKCPTDSGHKTPPMPEHKNTAALPRASDEFGPMSSQFDGHSDDCWRGLVEESAARTSVYALLPSLTRCRRCAEATGVAFVATRILLCAMRESYRPLRSAVHARSAAARALTRVLAARHKFA